jgi:hypothetical protein
MGRKFRRPEPETLQPSATTEPPLEIQPLTRFASQKSPCSVAITHLPDPFSIARLMRICAIRGGNRLTK